MLQKILDIQHPDRVKNQLEQSAPEHEQEALPVTASGEDSTNNRFYSLEDTVVNDMNAIRAVVHETQTVVSGATIKLRLLTDIYIAGKLLPKDHFVYGTASLEGERLKVTVKDIRSGNSILPVALSAYDMDGMEGIYIPGAIGRDVAKQSAGNSLQQVGLTSLDPSIGVQAAGAGIRAAKTLISKKARLIRVTLKAGYRVLLTNKNQP
jgi:conjugative transposon TraM protein